MRTLGNILIAIAILTIALVVVYWLSCIHITVGIIGAGLLLLVTGQALTDDMPTYYY